LAALERELRGADEGQAIAAIDELARRGSEHTVAVLEQLVLEGVPDQTLQHVLQALAATPSRHALPLLARLCRHRRPEARRLSYRAIAAVSDSQVPELLGTGLRDSDAGVRGLSAEALGELGARDQLPLLFRALARGVPQAAPAIGKLGDARDIELFHEQLQRLPINVMLAGYAQFLERPELAQTLKLDIVARLGEVASPSVKHFLEELLSQHDWSREDRLRHAVTETARRIDERAAQQGAGGATP
jgi:HEAT repeat protein